MKEKAIVILAAGMGSRFGGLKQLEPVGPNGELLIDYSVYSAVKYGFNKVVFVIRKEIEDDFKNIIGDRLKDIVNIEYVYQDFDNLPDNIIIPKERTKPLGTAHAIYCAKDKIEDSFAVITADDFYGDEAFSDLSNVVDQKNYAVIGYKVGDTLSKNGPVKRGVIISKNDIVDDIIESSCVLDNDKVLCKPLNSSIDEFKVSKDNSVSMLMLALNHDIFDSIEKSIVNDLFANKENLLTYELLLPDILSNEIKSGKLVREIKTNSKWYGVTYKEDLYAVKDYIKGLIEKGIYPEKLWKNKTR